MAVSGRGNRVERSFFAWLDNKPVSAGGKVVLVATAAALGWFWLYSTRGLFVRVVPFPHPALSPDTWAMLRSRSMEAIVALVVGALCGGATRRLRWIAGPSVIGALVGISVLGALPRLGRPFVPYAGADAVGRWSLQVDLASSLYLSGILAAGALGGLLSPALFRRVRVSALTSVAWAWIGAAYVDGALHWMLMVTNYYTGSYTHWSVKDVVLRCRDGLPYLAGGVWLGWTLRRRPWVAAATMGAMAAFASVRGHVAFAAEQPAHILLLHASRILTRAVVGATGWWLGTVLAGARSRRELLRPAVVIVCSAFAAALIAALPYRIPRSASAETGISSAVEPPVENGEIVLLTKGEAIGAVILTRQTMKPERVSYDWFYRTDGGGTFRSQDSQSIHCGQVHNATTVSFGPFSLSWSIHDSSSGFLYYEKFPGSIVAEDDIRICVTHELDLERIDAFDSRWLYKGSPSDVGVRRGPAPAGDPDAEQIWVLR
jgi:hypothetical protein